MPSPPLPPARHRRQLTQLQAELAELDARLARDQSVDIEGQEASKQSSGSPHQQTPHRDRPRVQSEPPPESLKKHANRAKRWATYITLVGGALASVLNNYYQQRLAQMQQSTPPAHPEPKVIAPPTKIVLGEPEISQPAHAESPTK